jgi:hypothetical protein
MFGTIDLAGRKTSPCHVLQQVQSGDYKRVFPTKPGTFDCAKKNVVRVTLTCTDPAGLGGSGTMVPMVAPESPSVTELKALGAT